MSDEFNLIVSNIKSGAYKLNAISVFFRNRPELLDELRVLTPDILPNENKEVTQRLYHVINSVGVMLCPICKDKQKKFRDFTKGYYKTCGNPICSKKQNVKSGDSTRLEKYGDTSFFRTKQFKDKMFEKLGVDNPFRLESVKNKIKETNKKRYGYESPMQNPKICKAAHDKIRTKNIELINAEKSKKFNVTVTQSGKPGEYLVDCHDCNKTSNFLNSYFNYRMRSGIKPCLHCVPIEQYVSTGQKEVAKFLDSIVDENPEINNRSTVLISTLPDTISKMLGTKFVELDILYKNSGIAIEFNGNFYHSELFKGRHYHQGKRLAAESCGIKLINIWEDLWNNPCKRAIIESRLLHIFGKTKKTYGARKLLVREVTPTEEKTFLERNHLQGYARSSVRYGLYDGDRLVSIMTFCLRRMGVNNHVKSYEMLRFCNELGTAVSGGASRLLSAFVSAHEFDELVTYASMDWSDGNLYETIGFCKVGITPPNYWWMVKNKRVGRFSLRKSVLVNAGADPDKSERDIMYEQRCWRIYDAGSIRYKYKKN